MLEFIPIFQFQNHAPYNVHAPYTSWICETLTGANYDLLLSLMQVLLATIILNRLDTTMLTVKFYMTVSLWFAVGIIWIETSTSTPAWILVSE